MGGEGGFLEKLKAMFMGGGAPAAPPEINEARPWDSQMYQRPLPSPMPGGGPGGPPAAPQGDPITTQVQQLLKQREIMKMLSPEQTWNTPQR